eukprot:3871427-Prymnesium_polylepis.1
MGVGSAERVCARLGPASLGRAFHGARRAGVLGVLLRARFCARGAPQLGASPRPARSAAPTHSPRAAAAGAARATPRRRPHARASLAARRWRRVASPSPPRTCRRCERGGGGAAMGTVPRSLRRANGVLQGANFEACA